MYSRYTGDGCGHTSYTGVHGHDLCVGILLYSVYVSLPFLSLVGAIHTARGVPVGAARYHWIDTA